MKFKEISATSKYALIVVKHIFVYEYACELREEYRSTSTILQWCSYHDYVYSYDVNMDRFTVRPGHDGT